MLQELSAKMLLSQRYSFIVLFLSMICNPLFLLATPLQINIICWNNSFGLTKDLDILRIELNLLGHSVRHIPIFPPFDTLSHQPIPNADINLFIECAEESLLPYAKQNYFIPNPEWCSASKKLLRKFDFILCRTKEIERIFFTLGCNTYFLGFASMDNFQDSVAKNYNSFLHMRSLSPVKGTNAILNLWSRQPTFPLLTLLAHGIQDPNIRNVWHVKEFLSTADLAFIQNCCGIHLCTSETEGFGHTLSEAMSTGAVVITTDAPPMNEFIKDKRCLVKYLRTEKQLYATRYQIDPIALEQIILNLVELPQEQLASIGAANRKSYLQQKQAFKERLEALFGKHEK